MSKGFRLSVLRPATHGDCTLNGVSGQYDRLTLVGVVDRRKNRTAYAADPLPRDMQMHDPDGDAVVLVVDHVFGDHEQPRLTIQPARRVGDNAGAYRTPDDSEGHIMFGGNYVTTTDSRWTALIREYAPGLNHPAPVAVHDRIEPWR